MYQYLWLPASCCEAMSGTFACTNADDLRLQDILMTTPRTMITVIGSSHDDRYTVTMTLYFQLSIASEYCRNSDVYHVPILLVACICEAIIDRHFCMHNANDLEHRKMQECSSGFFAREAAMIQDLICTPRTKIAVTNQSIKVARRREG